MKQQETNSQFDSLAKIGEGGGSEVFSATDRQLDRQVAIKAVKIGGGHAERERALREVRNWAPLFHVNIALVYDAFIFRDCWLVIVMELLGPTLKDRMMKPVNTTTALAYIQCLLAALEFAHYKGVAHRDVKPSNVLLNRYGVPKLADFGLAKSDQDHTWTQVGQLLGTPKYMCPELFQGAKVGFAGDLYAAAVVAYELFTGTPPFEGPSLMTLICQILRDPPEPPIERNHMLPSALNAVLLKALAKDPLQRYQSARDLSAALTDAVWTGLCLQPPPHQHTHFTLVGEYSGRAL